MAKKVTLNDVAKELSKTNKSVGDLGKELSKTIDDLGKELSKTNKSVDDLGKELSKTIDDLGVTTKEGFDGVDKRFDGVDKKLEQATAERKAMKRDVEEIKMKFAYTAWQIDVKELQERVVVLEKKNGIKH